MKKVILLLTVLVSVNCFSQHLNSNGEKIVSKLEIENYNVTNELFEKSTIKYAYSDDKLVATIKMTISALGDIETSEYKDTFCLMYSYSNGKITRSAPKANIDHTIGYNLFLNTHDKVIKIQKKFKEFNVERYVNYHYEYSDYDRLTLIRKEYNNGKTDMFLPISWVGGNMFIDDEFELTYSEYENDLNINPSVFLFVYDKYDLFNENGFEFSTEWFGMKSDNLLSDIVMTNGYQEYKYHIENLFDENENLTEIDLFRYYKGKWLLRKVINIHYLS